MKDYIVRAIAADGQIRAFAATTKNMVEEARTRHNMSPIATTALGRLMTGGAMMGTMMKSDADVLTIQIKYYNIRNPRLCQFPTFLSVFGSNHFINISKRTFYIFTNIRVILHHEHNGTSVQSRIHSAHILRWNGQFFHLALHMNGIGISIFRQQAQSKSGSHFRCTLHFQRTFVHPVCR